MAMSKEKMMADPRLRQKHGVALLGLVVGLIMLGYGGHVVSAQDLGHNSRLSLPRSHLGLDPNSSAFLVGRIGIGGGFSTANNQFGYGGAVIFHPDYASNFLDFLAAWNTGLVLQVDYQEMYTHYRIRSGDLIFRKYLGTLTPTRTCWNPYVGLGLGMSEISFAAGTERGTSIGWAPLLGIGLEGSFKGRYLVEARGQYRQYKRHGFDYINWSVRIGLGLSLPW